MAELTDYLSDLAGAGQLDSSGKLTVDLARSRLSLFKNQLPDPAMYLLKMVQALVRLGSSNLQFQESRSSLQLLAQFSGECPVSAHDLEKALLGDPRTMADTPLRDLVHGLGAALALGDGVGLECRGPGGWTLLAHPRQKPGVRGDGLVFLFDRFFDTSKEADVVRWRCHFCPIPITWNGVPIQKGLHRWSSDKRLMEHIVAGPEGFSLSPTARSKVDNSRVWPPLTPAAPLYLRMIDQGGQTRRAQINKLLSIACQAVVSVSFSMAGESRLLLVKDGVTLEPVLLHPDFGCQVVLSAGDVPLDLSGFSARQSPELDRLISQAWRRMIVAGGHIDAWIWNIKAKPTGSTPLFTGVVAAGTAVLGLGMMLSGVFSGAVLLGQGLRAATKDSGRRHLMEENGQIEQVRMQTRRLLAGAPGS